MMQKLAERIEKTAPIVVGLDPMLSYIPEDVRAIGYAMCGKTQDGAAEAILMFNKAIIDAVADLVPAVKPQIAMYEQFGVPGVRAFYETVEYAHKKGLLVIGDVKRGDIGSTSAAYAAGHLGSVSIDGEITPGFSEDFATLNPYLGSDGVRPFLEVCKKEDKGIFVLVKTSNPSSGEFQDQLVGGRPLYELVGEKVEAWGSETMDGDYSNVGAVIGATYPEMGKRLREMMPHTFFLIPGYGAQGGKGEDLKAFFHEGGKGAIVNSSRGIIAAWQKEPYSALGPGRFDLAARRAVKDMREDLLSHVR